jgi:hypothetical protein
MPNTSFIIKNAEYVEVPIPTGNTKTQIYFPDLPNLRNRPIFGMECFTSTTAGVTQSGATNQAYAQLVDTTVTLYYDGGEFIVVPAMSLVRINHGAAQPIYYDIPHLAGQNIVWTKSYVTMSGTIANYASKSFLFNVYYNR